MTPVTVGDRPRPVADDVGGMVPPNRVLVPRWRARVSRPCLRSRRSCRWPGFA